MLKKKRTFADFISCAEYLVMEGYTSNDMMAIKGGSSGGLLVATAMTMRPELFKVVIAEVPFVDVIHTMMDQSLPFVTGDYEELGDINEPEVYHYCKSYSPYENVREVRYPNLLVTTAMNDPRVAFWEPVKWVAKLRGHAVGDGLILLSTKLVGGHMATHARYDALKDLSFKLAFLIHNIKNR